MARNRDPLALGPHWRLDCRLESELPEESLVGRRFLINALCAALAVAALTYTAWLGYSMRSMQRQIASWEDSIRDHRAEVIEIQRLQKEYNVEAQKIEQAHALVRPRLYVAGFLADIGRTRPEQMAIDLIEWSEAGVFIRGSVQERSDAASLTLGGYVDRLRADEKIGPLFAEILLRDVNRGAAGNQMRFEIFLRLKP